MKYIAGNKKFYVPAESIDLYKSAARWSSLASFIEPIV